MFLSPWHRYLQAASGTVTDVFVSPKPTDVSPGVPVVDVGVVTWTPSDAGRTLVWQIGEADRTGGEFALAREPRGWFLPGEIFVFSITCHIITASLRSFPTVLPKYQKFIWERRRPFLLGAMHLLLHTSHNCARPFLPSGLVPGDLTFTVGKSNVTDWYYAQTQGGTWTVAFTLPAALSGTAYLTISVRRHLARSVATPCVSVILEVSLYVHV